ncbi:MAG: SWIM zinc finger domain-containing protein [Bacteroidia bacterium]
MLSIEYIRAQSSPTSFERGEDLYQKGAVRQLLKAGNTLSAEVQGSSRYQQTIHLDQNPVYAACSCPYDHGGWCKHLVAVVLTANDKTFTEEVVEQEAPIAEDAHDEAFYETTFLQANQASQEAFLRQLFTQRSELRQAFLAFHKPPEVVSFQQIKDIRQDTTLLFKQNPFNHEVISEVAYDDDSDNDYVSDDDLWDQTAEKITEKSFTPLSKAIKKAKKQKEGLQAIAALIGGLEALSARDNSLDEYDYDDLQWNMFNKLQQDVTRIWEAGIYTPAHFQKGIELVLDRWSHLHARDDGGAFTLDTLTPLLKALSSDQVSAQFLLHRLDAYIADNHGAEELHLFAAQKAKKDEALAKLEKRFRLSNLAAAKAWLLRLRKQDDPADFVAAAREALDTHKKKIIAFLGEHLRESDNQDLLTEVLGLRASTNMSMNLYRQWRVRVDEQARMEFLTKHSEGYIKSAFYLKLLIEEKQYETIRGLAKKQYFDSLASYLKPILAIYPDFCFNKINETLQEQLASASNRPTYEKAVALMKLATKIPNFKADARALVQHYASMRRPSQKRAMREAGLIQ